MIKFKEELAKFQPVLEIDDIEKSIRSDESQDILDLLHYALKRADENGEMKE